jgi:hypothetical protein
VPDPQEGQDPGLRDKLYLLSRLGIGFRTRPGEIGLAGGWLYRTSDESWHNVKTQVKGIGFFLLIERIHRDMDKRTTNFTFTARVVKTTPKALLLSLDLDGFAEDSPEFWVPLSQILDAEDTELDEIGQDDILELTIPKWLADEKGMFNRAG